MTAKSAVVVLVIGIPGAGKSSFASRLAQHFNGCRVIYFDSYVDAECVWSENTFKQYRELALNDVNQILTESNRPKESVLIIDDIMYLKSMRREIYVLARDNCAKLLCIWIDCSLDNAIKRNNNRTGTGKISEESIFRVNSLFEPPDPTYITDRHYIRVDANENDSLGAGLLDSIIKIQELQLDSFQLPSVFSTEIVRKSKKSEENSKMNYTQRIDIFLRSVISLMQSFLIGISVEERKLINKSFCSMKSNLLEIARQNAAVQEKNDTTNELYESDKNKYLSSIKDYVDNNLPQHIALIINEKLINEKLK